MTLSNDGVVCTSSRTLTALLCSAWVRGWAVNRAQKTVASIALGAALAVVASSVAAGLNDPADGGWFVYSTNSTTLYSASSSGSTFRTAAVWLAVIAIWFGLSWRVFRSDK